MIKKTFTDSLTLEKNHKLRCVRLVAIRDIMFLHGILFKLMLFFDITYSFEPQLGRARKPRYNLNIP